MLACLDGESPPVRRAAADALRGLGRAAAPALPALEALALHDPDDRIRELARRATDQIRSNTPAPVELTRLREELDRLKRSNDELREKLEKFERIERK